MQVRIAWKNTVDKSTGHGAWHPENTRHELEEYIRDLKKEPDNIYLYWIELGEGHGQP